MNFNPGVHTLDILTWRPTGSLRDSVASFYVGGGHRLKNPDLVGSGSDRFRLTSTAMGKVRVQLGVVLRNFDKFGVES